MVAGSRDFVLKGADQRTHYGLWPERRLRNSLISASTRMMRLFLPLFSILLVGASCLAKPGLVNDGGGEPSGAQPFPMQALHLGSLSGLFEVNTGVPIAVSGVQGGLYYSGVTDGGGLTGEFQVQQQDLLSVTYAEAIQVHGLAVGVVRHFVPGVNTYGDSHTDIRSQPTAWPVVLDWHLKNPTLTISPQLADWAIVVPPNGPKIRGHFAPLHNAADIEAALEYQGYGNGHTYGIGLAIRQGQLHPLGTGGLHVELLTADPMFASGAVIDVITLRSPGSVGVAQPACASAVQVNPGMLTFTLTGSLEPGWTFLLARASGSGDPICHSGLAATAVLPEWTVGPGIQDPIHCLPCEPHRPVGSINFCSPPVPTGPCPFTWTSNEITDFLHCTQSVTKLGKSKCGPPGGGSVTWNDSISVAVTVSTTTSTSTPGSPSNTITSAAGTTYTRTISGGITGNLTAGNFGCGQCGSIWLLFNVCARDWERHRNSWLYLFGIGPPCTVDEKGRHVCVTDDVIFTTVCSMTPN